MIPSPGKNPAMKQPGVLDIPSMKNQCSEAEWQARVDLAASYRLVDHYGLSDMMANHISSARAGRAGRLPDQPLRVDVRGDHRVVAAQGRPGRHGPIHAQLRRACLRRHQGRATDALWRSRPEELA
jgi:hypothetical protein